MAIRIIKGHKIRTTHEYPPIPDRSMDWSAVDDDTYDVDCDEDGLFSNSLVGRGANEEDAIDDLLSLMDDSAVADPDEYDRQAAKWDHARDLRKHS